MDVAALVDAELDLTGLRLAHRLPDVERHRARLGVRHQSARTEHATQLAELAHLVRRRDEDVELEPAVLDLLQVLGADVVGTGRLRLARLVADGDDEHAHGGAGSRRQHDGTAHDLIGVTRIDAEANHRLDRLVELGERRALHDLERLPRLVRRAEHAVLRRGPVLLAVRLHQSTTSTPIERAAPATIAMADSIESVLRSGIFTSAI